jgi:non-ribosomal peptide synthase protein (TIGR01720 family)
VKVRGYRIELGEIENTLLRHPQVKDAVVVARTGEGDTRLVAYACTGPHVGEAALREHLETYLPAYMVPAHVVVLDAFPLNANGKVDRGQLPDSNQLVRQIQYRRPGTPMEEQLAALWEQVLGIAAPGTDDNFFTVGGDSIKAIQVVSRLHSAGYKLEVKDLFRYPTIAALAPRIMRAGAAADQAAVAGDVPLTPVQKEFFRATPADWHHYNQSVLLRSPVALDVQVLEDVFNAIVAHHDVLRSVYQEEAGTVQQTIPASGPRITCPVFDLREAAGAPAAMLAEADRLQGSFDPARGPLLRLGLFRLPDGDRLLIAVHHLVIDSVSWRILLEDITTLCRQRTNGEPLRLPAKTDSFKTWSEALARHADHKTFLREVPYWQGIEKATASPLPRDFAAGTNAVEDAGTVSFGLSGALTGRLLTKANHAFNTTINDLLLTALGLAVHEVFGRQQLLVALEGHGREPLAEAVDVSRTVGWFTSIYPVLLNTAYAGDLGRQIKEVKEHLHRVPNNGVGYGILKHLTSRANKGDVDYCLQPEISFNYLGQFDTDLQASAFALAAESPGHMVSPRHTRWYSLDVSGSILDGELRLAIAYSRRQYRAETVEALASAYRNALERVIEYCAGRHKPECTPSDFTARELTIEELEDLLNE